MKFQVVYKQRSFSYDQDWLDAFKKYANAELIMSPQKLDADVIVIHHSITGQSDHYPQWLTEQCLERRGKLIVFHTNEFKFVKEREALAKGVHADYICTQLPDGRLYDHPVISMPHALNPDAYKDLHLRRIIDVGFRGNRYRPGIHDERNKIIEAFEGLPNCDIQMHQDLFLGRYQWSQFLNVCKAIPGAEAGQEGARIISPRHLEAVGCKTLQILLPGEYCGIISPEHYVTFTTVNDALEIVRNDKLRQEIVDRAYEHVISKHTYKHRIESLIDALS